MRAEAGLAHPSSTLNLPEGPIHNCFAFSPAGGGGSEGGITALSCKEDRVLPVDGRDKPPKPGEQNVVGLTMTH